MSSKAKKPGNGAKSPKNGKGHKKAKKAKLEAMDTREILAAWQGSTNRTGPPMVRSMSGGAAITAGVRIPFRRTLRIISHTLIVLAILMFVWAFVIWKWNDPVTAVYTWYEQGKLTHSYDANASAIDAKIDAEVNATSPPVPKSHLPARQYLQYEVTRVAAEASRYRALATQGQGIGRIMVPRLGLKMILLNGTDESSLEKGPGRDLQTYMPGQGQLIYIAGHRTTFLAPFADIQDIRNGDTITLAVPYGTFVYRVFTHVIVPADDVARLQTHGKEIVTLQACHPRFFATNRYLVYGRLVEVIPTHGQPYGVDHGKPYRLGAAKPSEAKK